MNIKPKHLALMCISICLAVGLVMIGCGPLQPEQIPTPTDTTNQQTVPALPHKSTQPTSPLPLPASAPRGAIAVELSFSEPPILGKPVQVIATFSIWEGYKKDIANIRASIVLNDGFELVDGNLTWKGALPRGSSVEIKAIVKAIKTGENRIDSGAQAYSSEGSKLTFGGESIYAYVSENSAEVSDWPLGPTIGHGDGGAPSGPPEGWEPPPGYEDLIPTPTTPPPDQEPPAQDVTPVDVSEQLSSKASSFFPESGEKDFNDPLTIPI